MFDLGNRGIGLQVRVSPGDPHKHGDSIEAQIARGKSYITGRGWNPDKIQIYLEEKISSKSLKRKEIQQLFRDIEDKKIGVVVVNRYDRFVRSVAEMLDALEFFRKHEVDFISITEQFDTTTPMGRAMFTIAAVFAEMERSLAAVRTDEVRTVKFDKTSMFYGRQPLGFYRNAKKQLVIDNRKKSAQYANKTPAEFIQYLFKLCTEENIPPYTMQKKLAEMGCEFSVRQLRRLLSNRTYLGLASFKGLTKQDAHEPLVDRETFEKVQEILSKPTPKVNYRLEQELREHESLKKLYNINS